MMNHTDSAPVRPTSLEGVLRHPNTPAIALLGAITVASWLWILVLANMYGPGASMMAARWDATHALLIWIMWAVMMAGMMLPSAYRVLLLYGALMRSLPGARTVSRNVLMLAAGYVSTWMLFSVAATAIQGWLATQSLISPMMEVTSPIVGAILLFVAGAYQFTPLKRACLHKCRSPLGSLMDRWRDGSPTFYIGAINGLSCVGCCWALMLLLFVGGVMNLAVVAALTAFIAFEKLTDWGGRAPHAAGGLLIVLGVWMLASSAGSYRLYVIGGTLLVTAQVGLIAALLGERVRRRRAEETLERNDDRKRAEAAIQDLESRNSAMLRAIPDLMFVILTDGTFVDYHAKDPRVLSTPTSGFIGNNIRDVMPPGVADIFIDALDRSSRSDEPVVIEYELPLDGGVRQFETRLVRSGSDRVLSIVRDVTDWKRANERNHDLARRLIASQEAERQRIGRELHDDLSQKLALLGISVDRLSTSLGSQHEQFRELRAQIVELAGNIHDVSHELHPIKLQTLGLVNSLQSLCDDVARQSGVHVFFMHENVPSALDPRVALCLYRIAQEALHNIARHSRAQDADLRLRTEHESLVLQIADSGIGFQSEKAERAGLGLVSMRERVALVNGHLELHALPGRGTRIRVRVPLHAAFETAYPAAKSASA